MQYVKDGNGAFTPLPKSNIDFGGGLERIAAAVHNTPDVFVTDLYADIIKEIEAVTQKQYHNSSSQHAMRVIADHMKAACFLIADTVTPGIRNMGIF
jgi:alanyl-tRNA synthetase